MPDYPRDCRGPPVMPCAMLALVCQMRNPARLENKTPRADRRSPFKMTHANESHACLLRGDGAEDRFEDLPRSVASLLRRPLGRPRRRRHAVPTHPVRDLSGSRRGSIRHAARSTDRSSDPAPPYPPNLPSRRRFDPPLLRDRIRGNWFLRRDLSGERFRRSTLHGPSVVALRRTFRPARSPPLPGCGGVAGRRALFSRKSLAKSDPACRVPRWKRPPGTLLPSAGSRLPDETLQRRPRRIGLAALGFLRRNGRPSGSATSRDRRRRRDSVLGRIARVELLRTFPNPTAP